MNSSEFLSRTRTLVISFSLILLAFQNVWAQQQSTDGTTPLGLSPGAPAGSYSLSGFEDVNLYNGTLNVALPMVKIGGRGESGYPLMLRVDHKWLVQKEQAEGQPPINIYTPMPSWWTDLGWAPIYSIGRLEIRQGGTRDYVIGSGGCGYIHRQTLTRLTFLAPDGTEYELRDQGTNGQPVNATCTAYNRGTTFVTADGTAATFVSDSNIFDYQYDNPANAPPSGYMMLRDGTRFRVDGGKVTWMRDRNGNKATFTYDIYQRMTAVTDSLNRQVTITYNTGAGTYDQISFKGFYGATRTLKVYFASLSTVLRSDCTLLTTAQMFPELNGAGSGYYNAPVVSAIELPNGKQYQFRYNGYAELSRVVLPTGGAIEYDYAAGLTDSSTGSGVVSGVAEKHVYRRVIERRVYPDGSTGSSYASKMTYSRPESSTTNAGYITTDQYNSSGTLLTRAIHYFYGSARASLFKQPTEYPAWTDGREYKTEMFASNGTTLLRRVENTFQQRAAVSWWTGGSSTAPPNDVRLAETISTLADTNQVTKQTFGYDDTVPFNNQNNVKEYDFSSGAVGSLVRETRTTYVTSSTYTGTSVHVRSLPSQVSTYDSGGVERARTTYEYDNYAVVTNHAALVNRSSISGFDSAFNTGYTTRGNITGTTRYLLSAGAVIGSVSSYSQYDIAGNITKTIDEGGSPTELIYDDCYGTPNGEARTNSAPTELSGLFSFAFPTSIKNSLNQWTFSQFDYYLGRPVDGEDRNGTVASGTYNDSLDRPTQVRRAAGTTITNQTSFSYDDTNRIITTSTDRDANNDGLIVTAVVYDQMGRSIETRQYEGGTNYIATQSQYDVLGRLYKTSNPFRPWLGETAVWTTTAFDTLDRPTSVTTPDSAAIITAYSGNTVTVTDQALKKRKTVSDALGRLKQAYEDPDTLNYLTSYDYDVLDNLTTVTQGAQTRSFVYDSFKRLTSATNPESGTSSYQYDNNSNLIVKTDARGVSTHYAYDALNRLSRRWYNGSSSTSSTTHNSPALPSGVGATDEANFFYDSQTLPSGAPSFSRGSSIGRMVAKTYGTSSSAGDYYGYDVLGKPVVKIQQIGGVNYQMTANYNVNGAMTSAVYPSGHYVNYTYDVAARTGTVTGNLGDGTGRSYATGLSYSPFGQLTREQFGTNTLLYHKRFYNVRGQLFDTRLSSVNDTWDWNRGRLILYYSSNHLWGQSGTDNTGNVLFAETWIPPENATLDQADTLIEDSFSYDALNRLTSVQEQRESAGGGWVWQQQFRQQYTYDRYGNRTIDGAQTWGTGVNNKQFSVDTNTNRLSVPAGQSGAMSYDSAGNLTNDTYTGAGNRTYNAENKITSAWGGNNQAQLYAYDADGQRIRRTVDGVATWHVYGFGNELLAEYPASGAANSPQKEYAFRNGEVLVTAEPSPKIQWLISDHLGTTRMVVDLAGNLSSVRRHDYLPFGEELFAGAGGRTAGLGYTSGDGVRQQFTQKERDFETGLDYFGARYYSSVQGRFTGVDPLMSSGLAVEPQSWNRYSFVSNNPLRYVDDEGLVKRDKNGNVRFDRDSPPQVYQHESGQSGLVEYGKIYGDDGTPITAFKNMDGGNYRLDTNCHGLTFADGQYWIFNNDVPALLQADGYKDVQKLGIKPQVGDVVVYTVGGDVVHSATVTAVDDKGNVTAVSGIAGVNVNAETTTPAGGWNDPKAKATYYHQVKDKRTPEQQQQNVQRTQSFSKNDRKRAREIEKKIGPPPKPPKLKKPPKDDKNG